MRNQSPPKRFLKCSKLIKLLTITFSFYKKHIKSREKNRVKSQFGEDITGSLGLDLKTVGGNLTAGFGRRNPNSMKGRERRGKRGIKHQKNKRFNPYRTSST